MGTHPIFESDFDCLTERSTTVKIMSANENQVMSAADSAYVKNHLEGVLTELLAELYLIQPADPIEWLSSALRQYARREETRKARSMESTNQIGAADGTALTTE